MTKVVREPAERRAHMKLLLESLYKTKEYEVSS